MSNREKKTTEVRDTAIKVPGFDKPGLILLAARPGMGKTTFALNLARTVAKCARKSGTFAARGR